MTLVASVLHHRVPYSVCEVQNEGHLLKMREKPECYFIVTTGFYLMNSEILNYIPIGKPFNINELIYVLKAENEKAGVYPISAKSWLDIGQCEAYQKTIDKMTRKLSTAA